MFIELQEAEYSHSSPVKSVLNDRITNGQTSLHVVFKCISFRQLVMSDRGSFDLKIIIYNFDVLLYGYKVENKLIFCDKCDEVCILTKIRMCFT